MNRCPVCRRGGYFTAAAVIEHATAAHPPDMLLGVLEVGAQRPDHKPKACMKIGYPTRGHAEHALLSTWRSKSARRHESRAYECVKCPYWHLTSKSQSSHG